MTDYNKYTDLNLSLLIRNGDPLAFQEIYQRYSDLLYIFAYKKLKNESEAKDVVHDVFANLLEKGANLTINTTLSSYLYKAVLNRIFDHFRKKETFKRYIDKGEYYIELDNEDTDYLISEKDIFDLIEREIAAMPTRMREVYELKYRQNLSAEQISEQLGISPHTVYTHIKYAKKHLKDKLGIIIFVLYILNK